MKIFKQLFTVIWLIFDVLMFIAALLTITITLFTQVSLLAGGISLAVSFATAGFGSEILSEYIKKNKGGD